MKQLKDNWFLEGRIDYEYKKYLLLAYLQYVAQQFSEVKLYPALGELVKHYHNLQQFQAKKQEFLQQVPERISWEDFKKLKLVLQKDIEDAEELLEIDQLIEFALPSLKEQLKEGKEIYELIEDQLQIDPVGISPLYQREGYVILDVHPMKQVKIYQYRIVLLQNVGVNYHAINLSFIESYRRSAFSTFEAKKKELIKKRRDLPNPATWAIISPHPFPEESTLLPLAKRKMLSMVGQQAA